jgi:hypothetical protein
MFQNMILVFLTKLREKNKQLLICFNAWNFLIYFIYIIIVSDVSKSIEKLSNKIACLILYFLKSFNFKVIYICLKKWN